MLSSRRYNWASLYEYMIVCANRQGARVQGGVEEVRKIMFEASYMVFGLGDVYLGAPCAVPVNPLHRCAPCSLPLQSTCACVFFIRLFPTQVVLAVCV